MVNTATYILNRTSNSGIDQQSPFEVWHKKKPKLKHLRVIGSICYAHIPKQNRKKMGKKAIKGVLMSYDNDDGYRIWSLDNKIDSFSFNEITIAILIPKQLLYLGKKH
ncbi:hypothetical protein JTB14_038415 [Gonioctena quinquepunctata]|nr:hypothetical protein JTB14_038415 [Gonioctena quinquepunctata]